MTDAWLGIDLGTQSIRAIVLDDEGATLGSAALPLTSRREEGRHEQDPVEWLTTVEQVIHRAVAESGGARVRALAVDGTSGTIVPLHADGSPAGSAVMYDDRRGGPHLEAAQEAGADVWRRLGIRMQATWGLPKLLAMRESGALPAGGRFGHQPDVVTAWLAGRLLPSDLSSALKTGADLDAVAWPAAVLDSLGVPVDELNGLAASGTVIGEVGARAAEATGLAPGTRIVAGFTDGCAAQIASGALRPGDWNSVLGTTLVLKGVAPERRDDPSGAVYAHRAPFDGGWYPGGASSTGAGALSAWLPGRDLTALTEEAAALSGVPVAYPLAGRGERFPFVADEAAAFGVGDPPGSLPDAELFAAVAHGVAFVERLALDLVRSVGYDTGGDLFLTGGGARNEWWNRLRADVLGRTVTVPAHAEGAAGMAVLAAAACAPSDDGDPLAASARRLLPPPRRVDPSGEPSGPLDEAYARFRARLREHGWLPSAGGTEAG